VRREAEEGEEKGGVWSGNWKWERMKGMTVGFCVWFIWFEVEVVTVLVERGEGES